MIDTTLGIEIGEPLQCADEELAALRIARLIAMRPTPPAYQAASPPAPAN